MINARSVIAIVPARGGSKGLPGKNIRPLCGKPLVAWTIETALRSRYVDAVVVTTDSEEIASVSRASGAAVPFLRPAALATDTASTYDVIRHALDYYRTAEDRVFDYVVLLEPTSPLREDGDVDRMLETLDADRDTYDSIVSLGRVAEHPAVVKRLVAGRVVPYVEREESAARRQDRAPAYFPYGVAYIAKTDVLLREDTFYTERCAGYEIGRHQNYEIDDLYDFLCVERVMQHQLSQR